MKYKWFKSTIEDTYMLGKGTLGSGTHASSVVAVVHRLSTGVWRYAAMGQFNCAGTEANKQYAMNTVEKMLKENGVIPEDGSILE